MYHVVNLTRLQTTTWMADTVEYFHDTDPCPDTHLACASLRQDA